jgi:quercetin dioxygenase-like cupin family protein
MSIRRRSVAADQAAHPDLGGTVNRKALLILLVVVLAGGAFYAGSVSASPGSGLTTTILAKSTFGEIDLNAHTIPADTWQARLKTQGISDAYVVDNKLAPGGTTGWHSHPGPSLILVVAGSVTNYLGDDPTCTGHVYTAGQGFIDAGGSDVHTLRNEGSVPAETIAVQLLPQGADRKIDKPDPGNCNF